MLEWTRKTSVLVSFTFPVYSQLKNKGSHTSQKTEVFIGHKKQRSSHSTRNRGSHAVQKTEVLTQHNNRGPHAAKKNRDLHTAQETEVFTQHKSILKKKKKGN